VILPEVWLYGLMEDCRMPRKRHKAEEIVTKLRQVDVLTAQGRPVGEAIRSIGVTEVTYYRWRSEYGGLMRPVRGGVLQIGDGRVIPSPKKQLDFSAFQGL
jgi:hypothetical protein